MIMEINLDISTIMEIYDTMQFGKGVVSPLNYKEAIVEIVGKIHSERILKRIYKFVLYLYTHETDSLSTVSLFYSFVRNLSHFALNAQEHGCHHHSIQA